MTKSNRSKLSEAFDAVFAAAFDSVPDNSAALWTPSRRFSDKISSYASGTDRSFRRPANTAAKRAAVILVALIAALSLTVAITSVRTNDPNVSYYNGSQTTTRFNGSQTHQQENSMHDLRFEPIGSENDRAPMTLYSSRILSGKALGDFPTANTAYCIVTVMNIDRSGCNPQRGKMVPVEIRIDSVVEQTPSFTLKEGDAVVVADWSTYWFTSDGYDTELKENEAHYSSQLGGAYKNDKGFVVQYQDGGIPITEEGSRYLVLIYQADEAMKEAAWSDLKFVVSAFTIPVSEDPVMSDDEIYELLKLPDDVEECSRQLIDHFFKE